ncbi:hypothetical protein [Cellulomonas oligotrophica]|uniref:Uncharacterized protein n=1 Tax=Cellulomonas oligotrophica TaxID=931536 RepID=A0A7Y9JXR9_9CELL|nr:hypothetical protein [Cellulomonas oligotrophica]NYD86166.1 hypothetical protein [Cellulomonas oligotrophica]GIG34322.1 hypothetical protein Col01nite_34810 [Cellulomonas oligotrophica]
MARPARLAAAAPAAPRRTPQPVDDRPRAGLVLYVSLPGGDDARAASATALAEAAETLREFAQELLPDAETSAALSLVPGTSGDVRQLGDRLTHLRLIASPDDDA